MRSSGAPFDVGIRADGVLAIGPAPIGTLWIPLHEGLTVLYGANGAGKSTVLNLVSSALGGLIIPRVSLSVHVSADPAGITGAKSRLLNALCPLPTPRVAVGMG